MSIQNATFVVQRGDTQFSCAGGSLKDHLLDDDLLIAQSGDAQVTVAGSKFGPQDPPWILNPPAVGQGRFHLKNYIGLDKLTTIAIPLIRIWRYDTWEELTGAEVPLRGTDEFIIHGQGGLFFNWFAGNWEFGELTDTSGCTDFDRMFSGTQNFSGDVSMFDMSSATTVFGMFELSAYNQPIPRFDLSSVRSDVDAQYMFRDAYEFDQDLSNWCVTDINSEPKSFFEGSAMEGKTAQYPVWGTCPPALVDAPETPEVQHPTAPANSVEASAIDEALFIVTDGDNGHKSVTGAQVKELFS